MHFLDDDLELVEAMPTIFKERFSKMKLLDQQAEDVMATVTEEKRRLFSEYPVLSKEEIKERSSAIKEEYNKVRDLYSKKCKISSELEQLVYRVNNKIKKDTDDFRYELELENPGSTYELEKQFTEECDRAFYRGAEEKASIRGAHLAYNGRRARRISAAHRIHRSGRHEKGSHRRTTGDKSMRKLLIDTSGDHGNSSHYLNVNHPVERPRLENGSTASSFRPSPVGECSPTPSNSRFSTPRHTPAPISPAVRAYHPSSNRYYQQLGNGSNISQFPTEGGLVQTGFDPVVSSMPSFAGMYESRHGRPRKLTPRVKQMLNEQKARYYHNVLNIPGVSPLSSQGFNVGQQFSFNIKSGNNLRRHSASIMRHKKQAPKKNSTTLEEEETASRSDEQFELGEETEEYGDYELEAPGGGDDEDTDQQIWCLCKTKSYGNMICCDNQQCPYTWFHYNCVGLTESPAEGQKWFCPVCRNRISNLQVTYTPRYN